MNNTLLLLFSILLLISCDQRETSNIEVIKFDKKIIDTLKQTSDTSYTSFVGRHDFYTIDLYVTYKDSVITRVLKDSLSNVVGFNRSRKGVSFFAAEYYPNGQLIGRTEFAPGTEDGPATYYYPDGRIKSYGTWRNYSLVGKWKNYNESGKLETIDYYDNKGEIIKTDTIR
jgi:hypothetical protein